MNKIFNDKRPSSAWILLAWCHIGIQLGVPMAFACVPAFADAAARAQFIQTPVAQATPDTRVYTLSGGETAASVAHHYNMDITALRKLNQFRTFARGFDALKAGDELDVPLAPLPAVVWHEDKPAPDALTQYEKNAQNIAGLATRSATFLANRPNADAAAVMARGMAAGALSTEAQQWLSHLGTARVQLDVDAHFSLQNSQFDLLAPLHEQQDMLLFTQASLHRTDDRTQSNAGIGARWFNDGFMLGTNSFLDYDLSRDHARMGVGLEYWRDFLKLSTNGYLRLTNWRTSHDLTDYLERPANGWDMRAEGWLPALPQLGTKIVYEQYYGKEVALFGKDHRQQNPYAFTAGINYTPFPLLTLSAEQRQGKGGKNDTRLGVQMNFQLGESWRQQIDPSAMGAMRRLAVSRYDLVERNNNIVLEYRKKQLIFLSIADSRPGYAGEQLPLTVSVNSKYGLAHIEWSAPQLLAAGGTLVQEAPGSLSVILPDYNFASPAANTYQLSGVAVDTQGNVSRRAITTLVVSQAAISNATSEFTPAASTLPADNSSQQNLILTIRDAKGHPIDIGEDEISVAARSGQPHSGATVSPLQRRDIGTFALTVTAGTGTDVLTLTPGARQVTLPVASVTIAADNATAQIKQLQVIADGAPADGKQANLVKVKVVDAFDNPMPDHGVTFAADNPAIVTASVITNTSGEAVAEVTSVKAGPTVVNAVLSNQSGKTVATTFVSDDKSARLEALRVIDDGASADGVAENRVTVRVTDAYGNAVPNRQVMLTADKGVQLSAPDVTTDNTGSAVFSATSTRSGTFGVTGTLNGQRQKAQIAFVAGPIAGSQSTLKADKTFVASDGLQGMTLTLVARDSFDNAVTGLKVDFVTQGIEGQWSGVTEQNGLYRATFTSSQPGLGSIGVAINGSASDEVKPLAAGVYSAALALTLKVNT